MEIDEVEGRSAPGQQDRREREPAGERFEETEGQRRRIIGRPASGGRDGRGLPTFDVMLGAMNARRRAGHASIPRAEA